MGDEGVAEADTFRGEPVHRGTLEPGVAALFAVLLLDRTHGVPTVVVGDDEDEVGLLLGRAGGGGEGEQKDEGAEHGGGR